MMTKQAELKKRAYGSNLKSRALSILIYLIDRSNKELTCFPAIPTMAEQLHISISTVKRALKELVDTGFIQKDSRFRENNRGQTSNLYTLIFHEEAPTPNNDNTPDHGDNIESTVQTAPTDECRAERITFTTIAAQQEQCTPAPQETADKLDTHHDTKPCSYYTNTPVHFASLNMLKQTDIATTTKENAGRFLPCIADTFMWTGVGVNLIPP